MDTTRISPVGRRGLAAAVLFVATFFAARMILSIEGADMPLRILAALIPVAPFAWLLTAIVARLKAMDELEQRIQLEALGIAFPVTMVILMTLGLLELAVPLPPEDLSYRHVWALLPMLYFIGLALARSRYR
ncbi:MAG: hypothetical protein HBSIN02_08630 [Bacteroidia bacterium]|nr:MAG: hypothetical protein HBSIN02_08630 [Bacteroidia bacterium]